MAATTLASAIVNAVLQKLSQDTTTPRYWTSAEILDLVWEGLLETTLITGHLQTNVTVTLTGNSIQYAPNHVAVLHLKAGNSSYYKYSVDELDAAKPTWDSAATGTPNVWAPVGVNKLLVFPRPPNSTTTITATVLQLPATLALTDTIPLEDEFVGCLTQYAFSVARLKEGGIEFKESLNEYDRYLKRVALLTERVEWKSAPEWTRTPKTALALATPEQI